MSKRKSTRASGFNSAGVLAACVVIACALFCRASADINPEDRQKDSSLRIYLPREVTVKSSSLSLAQVSIIRGDKPLAAKAGKIALGRISLPGQRIVLDRPTLLARLACSGIPASKVTLTGAEKITVKQEYQTITGNQFASLASSFLKGKSSLGPARRWEPIYTPKDFTVPGTARDLDFSQRLVPSSVKNQAKVEITLLSAGKKVGAREVTFALKYRSRQAVATVDIEAGETICEENARIEEKLSISPEPAGWKPPFGSVARRRLSANAVIRPQMVGLVSSPVVVRRNQSVLIRIESPAFLITASGTALQDGKTGEHVKVRNADSQRVIMAKVNADGSVEPVL